VAKLPGMIQSPLGFTSQQRSTGAAALAATLFMVVFYPVKIQCFEIVIAIDVT
jgi:hypothetical protein